MNTSINRNRKQIYQTPKPHSFKGNGYWHLSYNKCNPNTARWLYNYMYLSKLIFGNIHMVVKCVLLFSKSNQSGVAAKLRHWIFWPITLHCIYNFMELCYKCVIVSHPIIRKRGLGCRLEKSWIDFRPWFSRQVA